MRYVHVWPVPTAIDTATANADAIDQIRRIGVEHGWRFTGMGRLAYRDDVPIAGPDGEIWDGPVLVAICEVAEC